MKLIFRICLIFWKLFLCLSNCTGNRYICVFNYVAIWQTNIVWLIGRITYDWLPTLSQWNVFIVTNVENEDKYLYNPGAVFNRLRLYVRQIDLFLFVLWRYSSSSVRFRYLFLYLKMFSKSWIVSPTQVITYRHTEAVLARLLPVHLDYKATSPFHTRRSTECTAIHVHWGQ